MLYVIKKENLIEKMDTRIEFRKQYNSITVKVKAVLCRPIRRAVNPSISFKLTEMRHLLLYVIWRLNSFCFVDLGLKV